MLESVDRLRLAGFERLEVRAELEKLERNRFVDRMWRHDPDLWKPGDPAHAAVISNRLGWLAVPETMADQLVDLTEFADEVRGDGIRHVVLMGMGGSSLCPIVLRETFGVNPGYPELVVLDSTSPAAIASVEARIDVTKTLFIEASKSGTTLESRCFAEYFFEKAGAAMGSASAAARNFACITDPGTQLETTGRQRGYRRVFSNPPDIGGRYSALSFFGLVPGAVAGVDVKGLLDRARAMAAACAGNVPAARHPGAILGAALAQAALRAGRDKITFFASGRIATIGMWLEQLIAESTGKEGHGLVPIAGELPGVAGAYGSDRVFISLACGGDTTHDAACRALEAAGHPVVRIDLDDPLDVGAEFFRWEFATSVAGSVIGIDPFDEPNVKESKDNTNRILGEGVRADASAIRPDDAAALSAHVATVRPGDYIALQAFVNPTAARTSALDRARRVLRDATKSATTLGYGPRFLHSTGQLHKGGPNTGVYVQLVGREGGDIAIPGQPFGFATFIAAQGLGDLQSLRDHGRRAISVDLGDDVEGGIATFVQTIENIAKARH
jgi:transaldolase/glucose-6-phosphate isomerase